MKRDKRFFSKNEKNQITDLKSIGNINTQKKITPGIQKMP